MKKILSVFLFFVCAFCITIAGIKPLKLKALAHENSIKIESKSAYLVDFNSGCVIYSKNENERLPIASMCKIMTLLLTFENIDNGSLALDDEIIVSEKASGMGGSQVFLDANKPYKVSELIKSVVVASANDASLALAETISGSEEEFVCKMNEKCKELDMENTNFSNCTGLPKPEQYSSAKDVSIMFSNLIKFNDYFKFSKIWMDEIKHDNNRITEISNTNKLIRFYEGCDSGKTGYTSEAGHCLCASALRNGMRLISVVIKAPNSKSRFNDVSSLFNYGFANFENKKIIDEKTPLDLVVNVNKGKKDTVTVVAEKPFYVFSKKNEKVALEINFTPCEKIKAPINIGDKLGVISIYKDNQLIDEINILANENIEKQTFFDTVKDLVECWGI